MNFHHHAPRFQKLVGALKKGQFITDIGHDLGLKPHTLIACVGSAFPSLPCVTQPPKGRPHESSANNHQILNAKSTGRPQTLSFQGCFHQQTSPDLDATRDFHHVGQEEHGLSCMLKRVCFGKISNIFCILVWQTKTAVIRNCRGWNNTFCMDKSVPQTGASIIPG